MLPRLLTEFIGTFFLVLATALAGTHAGTLAPVAIGLVLMAMTYMAGNAPVAHFNPAVSLACALTRNLSAAHLIPYIIIQLAAAFAGAAVAHTLTGQHAAPMPGPTVDNLLALLTEILFTLALVLVVLNVGYAKKSANNGYFGAAIGLTLAAALLVGSKLSGGVFNPATGLGLCGFDAVMGGKSLATVWLYLAGPCVGAVLAAFVFKIQNTEPRELQNPQQSQA